MTEDPEHVPLNAILTADSHAGWQRVADEQGVSVRALVEVFGLELAAAEDTDTYRPDLILAARRLDVERRRRARR